MSMIHQIRRSTNSQRKSEERRLNKASFRQQSEDEVPESSKANGQFSDEDANTDGYPGRLDALMKRPRLHPDNVGGKQFFEKQSSLTSDLSDENLDVGSKIKTKGVSAPHRVKTRPLVPRHKTLPFKFPEKKELTGGLSDGYASDSVTVTVAVTADDAASLDSASINGNPNKEFEIFQKPKSSKKFKSSQIFEKAASVDPPPKKERQRKGQVSVTTVSQKTRPVALTGKLYSSSEESEADRKTKRRKKARGKTLQPAENLLKNFKDGANLSRSKAVSKKDKEVGSKVEAEGQGSPGQAQLQRKAKSKRKIISDSQLPELVEKSESRDASPTGLVEKAQKVKKGRPKSNTE